MTTEQSPHLAASRLDRPSLLALSALVAIALYVPALNEPLGTVALTAQEVGIVVVLSLVPFLCVEVVKGLFRRVGWTLEGARA